MGSRIPSLARNKTLKVSRLERSSPEATINTILPPSANFHHFFSTTCTAKASSQALKRKHRDPYALAQARQRKAANLARQAVLQNERAASVGDPIRGKATPFTESLRWAIPQVVRPNDTTISKLSTADSPAEPPPGPHASSEPHINHFLYQSELRKSIQFSHLLTRPLPAGDRNSADPEEEKRNARVHQAQHMNAEAALDRIFSLANASSKDRKRANIHRCIQSFGRHQTGKFLAPKPSSNVPRDPSLPPPPERTPRAGPDTGSSEVQIAILTTKIHALANHMEGPGRKDKVNKRNLRLLVHRRQKLLSFLRRKERGGERWQYVMQTLGLTEGAWKGEITLR
ncbi:MAG: hypothetical protein M1837_003719 [Sclerophora amabilis]|nr:MAG: hypothetical protein M1837_003719 [Sclerophora amabilis]